MLCTNLGKFVKHTESSKVQLVLQFRTKTSIHQFKASSHMSYTGIHQYLIKASSDM